MPDNTNNKQIFSIWRIAAYIIGSVGVIAGVHTSNMIITAISVVIGTIILVSARWRYGVGTHDELNKQIFSIWRIAAYIIGSVGVVAGVHTSNMIITAISAVIGTVILVSAKQRYRTGAFD